jgi:hypothetical protein
VLFLGIAWMSAACGAAVGFVWEIWGIMRGMIHNLKRLFEMVIINPID